MPQIDIDRVQQTIDRDALEEAIVALKAAESYLAFGTSHMGRQAVLRVVQAAILRAEKAAP